MQPARFLVVSKLKIEKPAWATADESEGEVITLRPPRVPSLRDMGRGGKVFADAPRAQPEATEHSAYESERSVETGAGARSSQPARTDTMIDDIAPAPDDEAFAAIAASVEGILAMRPELLAQTQAQVVQLALTIARRVIAHELAVQPEAIANIVREGLETLIQRDNIRIRVGTAFADVEHVLKETLQRHGAQGSIVIDPGLHPFGCVLETELAQVDESIEARIGALMDALPLESAGRERA